MNIFAKADLKKLKKLFESSFSSSAFLVIAARCVYLLAQFCLKYCLTLIFIAIYFWSIFQSYNFIGRNVVPQAYQTKRHWFESHWHFSLRKAYTHHHWKTKYHNIMKHVGEGILVLGGRHSSEVSSASTILRSRVRIPSNHRHFHQFILLKLLLQRENNENETKRGRDWPILKVSSF